MARQSRDDVQRVYRSGADAVVTATESFGPDDWNRTACGTWTATETARHLLAVVRWYDRWLDRALEGATSRPFPESEIHDRNAEELEQLRGLSGPVAVVEFRQEADRYLARTTDRWDDPYPYPFGVVTVGLHCGVAATEWHLHASDLAAAVGVDLHPSEPRQVFLAAGACMAAATGGVRGAVLARTVPIAANRSPWNTILRQTGRAEPTRRRRRSRLTDKHGDRSDEG